MFYDLDRSDTDSYVLNQDVLQLSHPPFGASLDALSISDIDEGQRTSAADSVYQTRLYHQREQIRGNNFPYAFSASILPPEHTVRQAAKFFFSDIAGLFFVMSEQDFETLVNAVFAPQDMPDLLALTEVCAIAAVGSQYHPDHIPDELKEAFFRTALQHIDLLLDTSYMRSMRTLACLGGYGIIEKRRSSRSFLHLGLQLIRWTVNMQLQQRQQQQQQWITLFRRLWRTFAFLDWYIYEFSIALGWY